jgi:hypothetical protein
MVSASVRHQNFKKDRRSKIKRSKMLWRLPNKAFRSNVGWSMLIINKYHYQMAQF